MKSNNSYPLIIIGAGPAGLTASIYASRYTVQHIIIGSAPGGLMFEAHKICNFPTEEEISGVDITKKIKLHAESLGTQIITDQVVRLVDRHQNFQLTTSQGKKFSAQAILLATGTQHRQLNLPEEKQFLGNGLSYCATCDAQFYRNQVVAVVGSGDSATTASLYFSKIAKKVYQICRGPKLHGEQIWINQAINNPQIEILYNRQISALEGQNVLEQIVLDQPYKQKKRLPVQGVFVEIGTVPQSLLINQLALETNPQGYVKTKKDQRTSRPGVWAAGDITDGSNNLRQIVTACSEGAIAADSIFTFFQKKSSSKI